MDGQGIRISLAGPDRAAPLARMLGRAFAQDPMMTWPLGLHGDHVMRFTRVFEGFLEAATDAGIVWEAGDAQGAAAWLAPDGRSGESDPWQHAEIAAVTDDGGRRYEQFWEWVEARRPADPLWQLDTIGVDPAARGRGIGRALIESGQARASSQGVGAFLSTGTERSMMIYERCGFRLLESLPAPSGGPLIRFMRWDP